MPGEIIQKYRKLRGLSQVELAAMVGVGQTYISALEIGKRVGRLDVLATIITALNIPPSEIVLPDLPLTDLPPVAADVVRRVGQYLNPADWDYISGYIEARAEARRAERESFGHHVIDKDDEAHNEAASEKTA